LMSSGFTFMQKIEQEQHPLNEYDIYSHVPIQTEWISI